MFNLFKGETKKIFLRPIIYIVGLILCLAMVGIMFIYNPEIKTNSTTSFSLSGNTISEYKANFASKQTEIDNSVEFLASNILVYESPSVVQDLQDYKENGKTLITLIDEFNNVVNQGIGNFGNDENKFQIAMKEKLQAINVYVINFSAKFNDTVKSTALPSVKITKKEFTEIETMLNNLKEQTTVVVGMKVDGYLKVHELINKEDYASRLAYTFENMQDISLSTTEIKTIQDKYLLLGYDKKQDELLVQMNLTNDMDRFLSLAKQYNSNAATAKRIAYLEIFESISVGMSDAKIQNLYNSSAILSQVNLGSAAITSYSIKENLTASKFIWENGYDFEYNYSSDGTIAANKASALDYALYALNIASFVVIIFCVILGATSVSNDINNGTLKMIAIKPIKRTSIVSAKILSTLLFGVIFTIFTALVGFGIGYFAFGYNSSSILMIFNAKYAFTINPILYYLIYTSCIILKMIVYTTLAIMLSTIFKNNIPALIFSLLFFFAGSLLASVLPTTSALAYIPLLNLDLSVFFGSNLNHLTGTPNILNLLFSPITLNGNSIWITGAYVFILPIIFVSITCAVFKKRDIH